MSKKIILHGMEIWKGRLRSLMWALLCFVIHCSSAIYAQAEMCPEIDYNKPTIAAGAWHTVGLKYDGTVVASGVGGNLGPGQLNVSDWTNIKAIAAGEQHTVGLKEDGTVVGVGANWWGQLNVSDWTNIKAIAAGGIHTIGLKEDGTVVAVGYNWDELNVSDWINIKAIAAGSSHTVGLKEDGTVVAVGNNWSGQLNVSDWTNIKAIAAGGSNTVGLKEDGTVVVAGDGYYGQLNASNWTGIKAIAAGYHQVSGLKDDGTAVVIGWSYGNMDVSQWANITAIASGYGFVVGLMADGRVVVVGGNWYGQPYVGDWTNIRQPACLNNAPVANAGPDQTIECAGPSGSSVTLNGSGSSDLDNDPLSYTWTWDGGSTTGVNPTISLPLGTTVITLTVRDGKATATDTVNITVQDTTPPVTIATGGSRNWYNANVISTFSATDSCSGIKEIHYTVNGSETVIPGSSASVVITTEGINNISYFAVDNAGNTEAPNAMTVKIDKTPPTVRLNTNPNILWPPDHKMVDVLVGGEAMDTLSGLGSIVFTVRDEYGAVQPSVSGFNTTIALEAWREGTDKDGRRYTIAATATDAAGNKTSVAVEVLVPHDQR